jgi:hypothetical protein
MREHDNALYENAASRGLRNESRDSLFLGAMLEVAGGMHPVNIRVRNLSRSGLMAEATATYGIGTEVTLTFKSIPPISGRVVWVSDGRMGIALNEEIDPRRVRQVITGTQDPTPDFLRVPASRRPGLKST